MATKPVRRFAIAVADEPLMLNLWDPTGNRGCDPADIGARSSRRRWWRCPKGADHTWEAAPVSIANSLKKGFTGCPCCAGRQLSATNSFAARYPEGAGMWHPVRNGDLTPDRVLGGSPDPVWWKCPVGPDHEWQVSPLVLGRQGIAKGRRGCPFCAGKRASVTNSVASHPRLADEWHPTRNGELQPEQVVASTAAKLWWRCLENPAHEWQATGANRTRGRSCPMCVKHLRSTLEVGLAYELMAFIPGLDLGEDKVVVDGVVRHVDLLVRDAGVVIEVDGRYRHKGRDEYVRDKTKTDLLSAAGFRVLRVREAPLAPISDHDVVIPTDATVKQATDATLERLRELGWIPLDGVDAYLADPEPRHLDKALAHLQADRPGRRVRLPGPVIATRDERWQEGLRVLRAFAAREGHANVPDDHSEQGVALGTWVGTKRAQYRRGRMAPDRIRTLEALPGWTWSAVEQAWEDGFQSLLRFLEHHGHVHVPAHYRDPDGFPLGSWVRSHRRPDGRRAMTSEQRAKLSAVPGWSFTAPTEVAWDTAFSAMERFATREGHCRTSRHNREDGIDVDGWSKRQRVRYHRGLLAADRAARLERLPGWSWRPQEDAWETGFQVLVAHLGATGTASVRRDAVVDGYPLGAWVGEQRNRYASGQLPDDRQRRLELLAGWTWDVVAESWERHHAALLRFVSREGHARVPTGHEEAGLPLAAWVIRHRQEHKAGKVPLERVRQLESLPGWTWDVLEERWHQHFAALQAFAVREGHARVPADHQEGSLRLGQWVITQRQNYRTGKLPEDRADRLGTIDGWIWDTREAAWDVGVEMLHRFHGRTGHTNVPRAWIEDGYRLGQWVSVQRGLIRSGKLRDDRRQRLADLFSW